MELTAGMAYDIATLLFNGPEARTNFPAENYPEVRTRVLSRAVSLLLPALFESFPLFAMDLDS